MASGGRSRLAAYVGRARKPAGAAVLKKDVAEAAGVTEVTIRNRYKGLRSALGI